MGFRPSATWASRLTLQTRADRLYRVFLVFALWLQELFIEEFIDHFLDARIVSKPVPRARDRVKGGGYLGV